MCHLSENRFGVSRALSDLCQRGCCMQLPLCIIASPFRNPTGQNCRSICFTYCALTLHCSYLTLISSYQSQSLAEQVPRQPQALLFNRESLRSRGKSTLGFGILHRLITNWKRYIELFQDMLIKNIMINIHSLTAAAVNSLWHGGGRGQVTVTLWLQLQVVCKATVYLEGAGGMDVQQNRISLHFANTDTRAHSSVCDYIITQWILKKNNKKRCLSSNG